MNDRQMRRRIIRLFCQGHITEFSMRAAIILLDVNGTESATEYLDWALDKGRCDGADGDGGDVTRRCSPAWSEV